MEAPIRTRTVRLRPIGIVAGLAAVCVVAATTLGGAPSRIPEAVRKVADYSYDYTRGARFETCWLKERDPYDAFSRECLQTAAPDRAVFLWGDSHAARLYPGLRRVLPQDVDVLEAARNGCAPILGGGEPTCLNSNRFVIEQLRLIRPGTVVLFGLWSEYGSAWERGSPMVAAFRETLRQIQSTGAGKIVVVGPAPLWTRPLPRLVASAWLNNREWVQFPERLEFGLSHRARLVDGGMKALLSGSTVSYFSAMDLLCDSKGWLTRIPGSDELSTWDQGHFTDSASDFVAKDLIVALHSRRRAP
jgi:hypothetical protein